MLQLDKFREPSSFLSVRRGATLIEVLAVLAVLALSVALLVPASAFSSSERQRLQSVANLQAIGDCALAWSSGREDGIVHPQSASGEVQWIGLGGWDWGGADGTEPPYADGGPDPASMGATTRPLNQLCFDGPTATPSQILENQDYFKKFHAPADQGQVLGTIYGGDTPDSLVSMFKDKGTSYQGEVIWLSSGDSGFRFGTFMRPMNLIPSPSETTLFYEARFIQAYIHSEEFILGGAFGGEPLSVSGWYGDKSKFVVLFADGSVRTLRVRVRGDVYDPNSFDQDMYPYQSMMARGPGWRADCFPAPFVIEHYFGNP